jgi:hypothetical protein
MIGVSYHIIKIMAYTTANADPMAVPAVCSVRSTDQNLSRFGNRKTDCGLCAHCIRGTQSEPISSFF